MMMNAKDEGWHVGARVFVVEHRNMRADVTFWATVTAVGRKWVDFQRDGFSFRSRSCRFNAETMAVDGGNYSSPGRVYLSEWEYLESLELNKAWGELMGKLSRYSPPSGITMKAIQRFAAECGLASTDQKEGQRHE